MKALLFFSLCVICAESKLESDFAGTSRQLAHGLFAVSTKHRRQVRNPREEICSWEEISRRELVILCDPSNDGYGQQVVDIYNECSYDAKTAGQARRLVQSCTRDKNGRFCYELRQNASKYANSVTENCPRLSNYSEYQCTNSCRDALQNLKLNLGCCLNNLYNTTLAFRNFLNTGLWSACGVNHPDFCSDNTLIQGSVTTSGNCSDSRDLFERLHGQFTCNAEVFHPYLDIYKQCGNHDIYETYINACRVTDNDELCVVIHVYSNVTSYLRVVESECQMNSTQGCTHSCQSSIE